MTDRELDVLVAEKVMGWRVTCGNAAHTSDFNRKACCSPDFYSTNISAAWQVVEKMKECGFYLSLQNCCEATEWCVFLAPMDANREECGEHRSSSAPRSICIAALAAVGVYARRNR